MQSCHNTRRPWQHVMALYINVGFSIDLSVPLILRIHILTEMTQSFTAKQNQYRNDFSYLRHIKVPIHKIKFCFTICMRESVNHSCCAKVTIQQFLSFCNDDADTAASCAKCIKDFLGDASSWAPNMFTCLRTCVLRVLFGSKIEPTACTQC